MAKKKRKPDKNKQRSHQTHLESPSLHKSYENLIRQKFKTSIRNVKSQNMPEPKVYDGLDYDASRQNRRMQAISRMLNTVKERFAPLCEDVPGCFSIEEEWADINSFPIPAYDFEESFTYSIIGAAIWMLDRIKEANLTDELLFLIKPIDEDSVFALPPIWDPCHSHDVIYSMVDAAMSRNDPENRRKSWPGEIRRPYMNLEVTNGTVKSDWEDRSIFDSILDLIPKAAIEEAVQHYEARYWDYLSRYFRSRNILVQQEKQLHQDMDSLDRRIRSMMASISASAEAKIVAGNKSMLPLAAPSMAVADPLLPFSESLGINPAMVTVSRLDAESDRLEKREEAIAQKVEALWQRCGFFNQWTEERMTQNFGKEIADIWKDIDVGDPYEMCFAFMYLVDSGSDLPWCYFGGVNLHTAYSALLPWPRNRYNVLADGIWNHFDEETGSIESGPEGGILSKKIRVPELEDWNKLQYRDLADDDCLYNLGQVIYETTGCLMPRKLDRYLPALKVLDRYGITGKKALHPLYYCMTLLGEGKNQTRPYFSNIQFIPDEQIEDDGFDDTSTEALKAEIASLKSEIKRLKQQSYDTSREVRDEKERYEALAQKAAYDAQELHDLRELVFNQQNDQFAEEDTSTAVSFPYHTDSRIVVFGGHDSWTREIKPKLPGVRFIDRNMVPNSDMIRKADVVWIQTNAISHGYYYKIIDEVRKYNVRVRYFSFASASKCAEQIVADEKAMNK